MFELLSGSLHSFMRFHLKICEPNIHMPKYIIITNQYSCLKDLQRVVELQKEKKISVFLFQRYLNNQ